MTIETIDSTRARLVTRAMSHDTRLADALARATPIDTYRDLEALAARLTPDGAEALRAGRTLAVALGGEAWIVSPHMRAALAYRSTPEAHEAVARAATGDVRPGEPADPLTAAAIALGTGGATRTTDVGASVMAEAMRLGGAYDTDD